MTEHTLIVFIVSMVTMLSLTIKTAIDIHKILSKIDKNDIHIKHLKDDIKEIKADNINIKKCITTIKVDLAKKKTE